MIPPDEVDAIREEAETAHATIERNRQGIKRLFEQEGANAEELLNGKAAANDVELRRVRRVGHPPKSPNDIIWMPKYAQHLANPVVTAVARHMLDDHHPFNGFRQFPLPLGSPRGPALMSDRMWWRNNGQ